MVMWSVVTGSVVVTSQNLPTGDTAKFVSHSVPGRPSMAITAEWLLASGMLDTSDTPTTDDVVCTSSAECGKMLSDTLGRAWAAGNVGPAFPVDTFHKNDVLRLLSVTTRVGSPATVRLRALASLTSVPP